MADLDPNDLRYSLVSDFTRPFRDADFDELCKLYAVQINIDSSDQILAKRISGTADRRVVARNLRRQRQRAYNIVMLRTRKAELRLERPLIIVNYTISRDDFRELAGIAALCKALGVEHLLFTERAEIPKADLEILAHSLSRARTLLDGSQTTLRVCDTLQLRLSQLSPEPAAFSSVLRSQP